MHIFPGFTFSGLPGKLNSFVGEIVEPLITLIGFIFLLSMSEEGLFFCRFSKARDYCGRGTHRLQGLSKLEEVDDDMKNNDDKSGKDTENEPHIHKLEVG